MKFIFSIITLASIAGALMMLYVGAGSFLKLNQSSDEEKALAAERTTAMISRLAQRNGVFAKVQANGNPSFGPLNVSSWNVPTATALPESAMPWRTVSGSDRGDVPKSCAAAVPSLPVLQPSQWAEAAFRIFAPAPPRIIPRRTPTPSEEALAVYRKYATPP